MESKDKKPIYKKIWFWVGVIIIISIIGGAGSQQAKKVGESSSSSDNSSSASSEQEKTSDEKTEFKIGDVIAFDGKELTVEKVERNYNTGSQFITPKEGKEFVKINVKIENKSDKELDYNSFDFKVEDNQGAIETYSVMAQSDDAINYGELAKNGKKTGSVVFEVPTGSALKLHYQPSFWSNKKVIVNL